ncbi:hypothetical protein AQJ23_30965 [Streptomyces antibioticus]|nr:tetratricopeptide repeat protein [Streptomyces antibioticus]KUN21350.1 hypothetical protein AQJ23_30965 [Streptomyces antibioticus]
MSTEHVPGASGERAIAAGASIGMTHPHALSCGHTLALAYGQAGDLERATQLLEITLTQFEQVLGPTHPYTETTRRNLAAVRQATQLG